MKTKAIFFVLFAAAVASVACNEIIQTVSPSDVSVTTPPPAEPTTTIPPAGPTGTIALDPPSIQVAVGKNANVMVIVKDENGQEIPSTNISVNILDKTILELVEIDNRIIAFGGVAAGVTSVIVSASGLQTSLVATVTP